MPTKFTGTVGKLLHLNAMRKNCLQQHSISEEISWEYVPVLEYIKKNPGCRQVDISKEHKITAAAVTQSTQKLEGAGLIEKRIDPDNLRIKQMYITDAGIAVLKRGSQIFDEIDHMMFKDFSDDEMVQLETLLKRACENMSEYKNTLIAGQCLGI